MSHTLGEELDGAMVGRPPGRTGGAAAFKRVYDRKKGA